MRRKMILFLLVFTFVAAGAQAGPLSLVLTPQRAELAFTIKPFEVFLSDNFAGTIDLEAESSFTHDLYCGARVYLPSKEKLDTYLFGSIGLADLDQQSQEFKVGLGKQYNFDKNFAVFGELGAKAVKTGSAIEVSNAANALGLRFSF